MDYPKNYVEQGLGREPQSSTMYDSFHCVPSSYSDILFGLIEKKKTVNSDRVGGDHGRRPHFFFGVCLHTVWHPTN